MPLPAEYNKVTVRGKFVYLDGTPVVGSLKFEGKVVATAQASSIVILPTTITVTLDSQGEFSLALPATDDPDIQPNGWTYKVTEEFNRGSGRIYEMDVPVAATATGIDLADVAPATPASGDPNTFVTISTFAEHTHDGNPTDWPDITNKPTTFTPSAHTHAIADVTALQTELDGKQATLPSGTSTQFLRGSDKTFATITKSNVGLANVDNTSDLAKPISTAAQTALDAKRDVLVLATGAAVPGGTRIGTVILRTP